ncbi:MAG: inositol monophosphatase, partial [Candidatus Tectomicrobia bacterium]|nr:inositol monophosphatase [Candidatus Tectomicrobia bacterium]
MDRFLQSIIRQAGAMALSFYHRGVTSSEKDNRGDLLTEADVEVSAFLVEAIHERYPQHHIASEELDEDINPGAPIKWVIDPIDGTRNFANAIPVWCTLIGVIRDGDLYLGAIYDAVHDTLFFAERGKGAYKNAQRIYVN